MTTTGVWRFGAVTAALLGTIDALGLTTVAVVLGAAIALLAVALLIASGGRAVFEGAKRPGHEITVVWITCALIPIFALVVAILVRRLGVADIHGNRLWPWRGIAITGCVAVATFFLSSMVDWCYVWPRMRGKGDERDQPCQSSTDSRWRGLTRIWLMHRMTAYIVGRLGALVVFGFLFARFHPQLSNSVASGIATFVAAVVVFYLNRVVPIGALATNPPLSVGDKVVLAEEYGTGVSDRPQYYVVDVAIEGVKLLEVGANDHPVRSGGHDRSLSLADVHRLLRARQPFEGCSPGSCCGANEHCVNLDGSASP
jgi:hypothetical protein